MDESYFRDRISAYKDHSLPPYEEEAVRLHLEECEECRRLLTDLERLDKLVEDHSGLDGDEYWERSAQRIEKALGTESSEVTDIRPEKRSRGILWKWVAAAASVAVLTFIGLHQTDILDGTGTTDHRLVSPQEGERKDQPAQMREELKEANEISLPAADIEEDVSVGDEGRGADVVPREKKQAATAAEPSPVEPKSSVVQSPSVGVQKVEGDQESSDDKPDTEAEEAIVSDENYRARKNVIGAAAVPDKSAAEMSDMDEVQSEKAADKPTTFATDELAQVDSQLVQQMNDLLVVYSQTQSLDGGNKLDIPSASPMSALTAEADSIDVEKKLLEVCNQVVLQSADSSAVQQARQVLTQVARNKMSLNQAVAQDYLKQLKEDE